MHLKQDMNGSNDSSKSVQQTLLQTCVIYIGVKRLKSPAGHPEIASKDVKFAQDTYSYNWKPSSLKQNNKTFHSLVEIYFSGEVISIPNMIAFYCLDLQNRLV